MTSSKVSCVSIPSLFRQGHDVAIVKWLRLLADAIEAKQVAIYSFGKPEIAVRKHPDQYQFCPDIRFLMTDDGAKRLFSSFPPGPDA